MTIYSLLPLLGGIINATLLFLVFINNRKKSIVRSFVLWNIALFIWNIGLFLLYNAKDESHALFYNHILVAGTMFVFSTNFNFILNFTNQRVGKNRLLLAAAYAGSVFFVILHFWPGIVSPGVRKYFWGYYPASGPGDIVYGITFAAYTVYAQVLLYRKMRSSSGQRRNQYQYIFWATTVGLAGTFTNFSPVIGIEFYPIGNLTGVIYYIATVYALITVKMVSFRYLVRQVVRWTIITGVLFGVSILVAFLIVLFSSFVFYNVIACIWLSFFIGIFLTKVIREDRDKNKKSIQRSMNMFLSDMCRVMTTKSLVKYISFELARQFKIETFTVVLQEKVIYEGKNGTTNDNPVAFKVINSDIEHECSLLWECLKIHDGIVLRDEIEKRIDLGQPVMETDVRLYDMMNEQRVSVLVPVKRNDQRKGFFLLGHKYSGYMYDDNEINMLYALKIFAEIALENIACVREITDQQKHAQQEMQKSEKLKSIGLLSAAIAHELRNPLAVMKAAMYNIRRKAPEGLLDRHLNNIDKKIDESSQIIQNLLSYSRAQKVHFESVSVITVLRESMQAMKAKYAEYSISFEESYSLDQDCIIHGNPVQLKILFCNILDNACQSLPNDRGTVCTTAELVSGEAVQVSIRDNGSGISPADLKRVYEPFFTRKSRGIGLGLTVCRQIVELHDGEIDIDSKSDIGTTFTITLSRGTPPTAGTA